MGVLPNSWAGKKPSEKVKNDIFKHNNNNYYNKLNAAIHIRMIYATYPPMCGSGISPVLNKWNAEKLLTLVPIHNM